MKELSFYLEKFKTLGLKEGQVKETVITIVEAVVRTKISRESISYDTAKGIITISAHPVVKNELYMHREQILEELKKRAGAHIQRIR